MSETLKSGLSQSTVIYDKKNEEARHTVRPKRNICRIKRDFSYIQDAVISTEDRNFTRASRVFDIKGRLPVQQSEWSCLAEHQGGGGSTITQQLAKNAYLTLDQTFDRKRRNYFWQSRSKRSTAKKKS